MSGEVLGGVVHEEDLCVDLDEVAAQISPLKQARWAAGLRLNDVAEIAGVSPSDVARLEAVSDEAVMPEIMRLLDRLSGRD